MWHSHIIFVVGVLPTQAVFTCRKIKEQDMSKFVNKKNIRSNSSGRKHWKPFLLQSPVFFYWLPVSMLSMVDCMMSSFCRSSSSSSSWAEEAERPEEAEDVLRPAVLKTEGSDSIK